MGRERFAGEPRYCVVIDCDPGADDALALLAALAAPVFQLDLVTTVAGNGPLDQTDANARAVVALSGRTDVPVYPGGDALFSWLRQTSELPKRLIAIGPLTNIAAILRRDRGALADIEALYVMGGSLSRHGGRFSPVAETNFFLDPVAAAAVMGSGANIRLFDYDATRQCAVSNEAVARINAAVPPAFRQRVRDWLGELYDAQVVQQGHATWAIHDLCVVAGAAGIEPGRWATARIRVETAGSNCGAVIAEPVDSHDPQAVQMTRDLDVEATLGFLTNWLDRLPAAGRG
jgi:purine nucleosidase